MRKRANGANGLIFLDNSISYGRFARLPFREPHFGSLVTATGSYPRAKASLAGSDYCVLMILFRPASHSVRQIILRQPEHYGLHWDGSLSVDELTGKFSVY